MDTKQLVAFCAVVERRSFSQAADQLGVTQPAVSLQIRSLEQRVGQRLLDRSGRRVEPTEAGRMLHARCAMILREAEDAFDELAQSNAEPMGVLRVAAPNDYGTSTIAPLAAAFSRKYPACRVELILSDTRIDVVANQVDLSIRVGWLSDSSLQARQIGAFRQWLVSVCVGDLIE